MAPYDSLLFEEEEADTGPDLSEKLEDIESQFKSIQVPMLLLGNGRRAKKGLACKTRVYQMEPS